MKFKQHKINHFKVCDQWHFIYSHYCANHSIYVIPKYFITHKVDEYLLSSHPLLPRYHPWQLLICFLFIWIYLFLIFHKNGNICDLLCLTYLVPYSTSFLSILKNIPFMYITHFIYPFTHGGHLSCFHLVAIVTSATMNIHVQVFL